MTVCVSSTVSKARVRSSRQSQPPSAPRSWTTRWLGVLQEPVDERYKRLRADGHPHRRGGRAVDSTAPDGREAYAAPAPPNPAEVRDAKFGYALDVILDGLTLRLPR